MSAVNFGLCNDMKYLKASMSPDDYVGCGLDLGNKV